MNQILVIDRIKRIILQKSQLSSISPSDCKHISLSISKKTNKTISETTIKRLFGFAETKNNFSRYTINALLEYIDEVETELGKNILSNEPDLNQIHLHCLQITKKTLSNIRQRCGIPYQLTMPRIFPQIDFDHFYESNYSFMAIISRAGCGKTIILNHLVERHLATEENSKKNDTLLFLTAREIFEDQINYTTVEERIKAKIGLDVRTDLVAFFTQHHQQKGSKFIIIIDGFSEITAHNDVKVAMFDKLINLICTIGDSTGVKLMFAMRSNMWNRFFDRIRGMSFVLGRWFPGICFDIKDQSNIPPLALEEIDEILLKIDPQKTNCLTTEVKSQLKYPSYIQWYYLLKGEFPHFDTTSDLIFYEIIDRFIVQKVFESTYATEKVAFCKKLSSLIRGQKSAPKSAVLHDLATFKNAYKELLADGILMEEKKEEDDGFTEEHVRFVQPHVFEYFLFLDLYHRANKKMDNHFFEQIYKQYTSNTSRFQLLQWSAKFATMKGDEVALQALLSLSLSNYEKKSLIHFITEYLNYSNHSKQLAYHFPFEKIHKVVYNQLAPLDFIDSHYIETISSLIEVPAKRSQTFRYLTILAIYNSLSLQPNELIKNIAEIEKLNFNTSNLAFPTLRLLNDIYQHLLGNRGSDEDLLLKIEEFKQLKLNFNTVKNYILNDLDMLNLALIMIHQSIHQAKEIPRTINAISTYLTDFLMNESTFSAYFLSVINFTDFKKETENNNISSKIKSKLHLKTAHNSTQFSKSLYLLSKAYRNLKKSNYNRAIIYAEKSLELFQRNKLKLIEIALYDLLDELYELTGNKEKRNNCLYLKMKYFKQQQVSPLLFREDFK